MRHPRSKLPKLLLTLTALALLVVVLPGTSALSTAGPLMRPDWSPMHGGTGHDLHGVWGSSDNDVFAVGSETIVHHPGHFTTINRGVNWGLVGRIIAVVVLVGTVFCLMLVIHRRLGKTVEDK